MNFKKAVSHLMGFRKYTGLEGFSIIFDATRETALPSLLAEMNEKQVVKLTNPDVQDLNTRKLNNAGENFLTESGVYKLIFKSRKPEAEKSAALLLPVICGWCL